MSKADIGLIGLAVMGENLILNMESKGFTVACYNRTVSKVDNFINGRAKGKNIMEKWDWMVENYYTLMGWDTQTGKPLPETLRKLGLEELIEDL